MERTWGTTCAQRTHCRPLEKHTSSPHAELQGTSNFSRMQKLRQSGSSKILMREEAWLELVSAINISAFMRSLLASSIISLLPWYVTNSLRALNWRQLGRPNSFCDWLLRPILLARKHRNRFRNTIQTVASVLMANKKPGDNLYAEYSRLSIEEYIDYRN